MATTRPRSVASLAKRLTLSKAASTARQSPTRTSSDNQPDDAPTLAAHGDLATVDIPSLQRRLASVRASIKQLAQERAGYALAALRGDKDAKAAIAEIDAERERLLRGDETISAALDALHTEHRSTWRKHLPRMQHQFRYNVGIEWTNFSPRLRNLMVGRQSHDRADLRQALEDLEKVEAKVARDIAENTITAPRVFWTAGDLQDELRARKERERLEQERQRHVAEAISELLSSSELKRPPELADLVAEAEQRLAVGA